MKKTLIGLFTAALWLSLPGSARAGIDFQGIDLQGIDLQGIDLQGIDLQGIDLQGIDLQGIDLQGIDLQGIDLQGIDLQGDVISATLNGSGLELVVYLGTSGSSQLWLDQDLYTATVIRYDSRSGMSSTRFRHGFTTIEFEIPRDDGGDPLAVRLTNVGADMSFNSMGARHPNGSNSDVILHTLEAKSGNGWVNLCGESGTVVLLKGSWTDGVYSNEGISFSCSGIGVAAKCVQQWGYKPWKSLPYGPIEVDLDPLFHACTRAAMADYCGNGVSFTHPDTAVDIFDFWGFNSPASDAAAEDFGAANNLPTFSLTLESVLGAFGTVAHHQERYQTLEVPLVCEDLEVAYFPTEDALWEEVYTELLPWPSANPYGMDWPYIGVRSDPTTWQLTFPDLGNLPCMDDWFGCP